MLLDGHDCCFGVPPCAQSRDPSFHALWFTPAAHNAPASFGRHDAWRRGSAGFPTRHVVRGDSHCVSTRPPPPPDMASDGSIRCRALVMREAKAPLTLEEVVVAPPKAGEVRIRIKRTAVCHTGEGGRGGG
jgi:hypothetical protein